MANNVKERITQLTLEDNAKLDEKFKGEIVKSMGVDEHGTFAIIFESGRSCFLWGDYDGYINLEEV